MRRLGRRQLVLLRSAAEGTASLYHVRNGRHDVHAGHEVLPESVFERLADLGLVDVRRVVVQSGSHERFQTNVYATDAGLALLAELDQ